MPLSFPRKFTHGIKLRNADVYAELFAWPDGHFQFMVHTRSTDPGHAVSINASIVLLDEKRQPLGTFGMPRDQVWRVGPQAFGQSSQRHDELYGVIPAEKLMKAESVALVLKTPDVEIGLAELQAMARTGSELQLCPIPD
jgi:hypothetical protein